LGSACDRWCDTLKEIAPTPEEWNPGYAALPDDVKHLGSLVTAATLVLYDRQATPEALHRSLVPLAPYLLDDDTGQAVATVADWMILEGISSFYDEDRERALAWAKTRGKGGDE
jgi:hypothetical protein